MRITADTNLLVRAAAGDDPAQEAAAVALLRCAETIAIPSAALCELCWVLRISYGIAAKEIAAFIKSLVESATVEVDRDAVASGLTLLQAGGDFADGVIAEDGRRLGGDIFASFDAEARKKLAASGFATGAPELLAKRKVQH